jgi:hypothetical protein
VHIHGEPQQETAVDLIGVYRGRGFAIELKLGVRTRASAKQQLFLDAWAAAGGVVAVAHTVGEALAVLEAIDSE